MAQLPSQRWVMQQIGDEVILFDRDTEIEIAKFNPANADATAKAQKTIHDSDELDEQDRCFAHFWSGYFHAHAMWGAA